MRKVILNTGIVIILIHLSLSGYGQGKIDSVASRTIVEKVDFRILEKYARKEIDNISKAKLYVLENYPIGRGVIVNIFGSTRRGFTEIQTLPLPAYWQLYKLYYPNGIIKEKGKGLSNLNTKIGVWQYFDQAGKLVREVDNDKHYGCFSYVDVLGFLIEKGHLDANHRGIDKVAFSYSNYDKVWRVRVEIEPQLWKQYIIDGESGTLKKETTSGDRNE